MKPIAIATFENWFRHLTDARRIIGAWKDEYNERREHGSLGGLTPREFAQHWTLRVDTPPGLYQLGEYQDVWYFNGHWRGAYIYAPDNSDPIDSSKQLDVFFSDIYVP